MERQREREKQRMRVSINLKVKDKTARKRDYHSTLHGLPQNASGNENFVY